jgi:hypothetical protein
MYLETNLEAGTIKETQIVVIYNRKHNITFIGKAGFAPINLYDEFKNACISGNELVINGIID